MKVRRVLLTSMVVVTIGMMVFTINCNGSSERIEYFTRSHACPGTGTIVTLKWKYTPDLNTVLSEQALEFMVVTLGGDGMETVSKTIPNGQTEYSFKFIGTVGIKLTAKTTGGKKISAYMDIQPYPCTEKEGKPYHLTGTFANRGHIDPEGTMQYPMFYPDLGCYTVTVLRGCCSSSNPRVDDNPKVIDFTTFFAAYDVRHIGKIDSLESMLFDKYPFRAFTSDPNESQEQFRDYPVNVGHFGMNGGCLYPPAYGPTGELIGDKTLTKAVVYGAALVPDGWRGKNYRTEDGQGEAFTYYYVTGVQPVFVAVSVYVSKAVMPGTFTKPGTPVTVAEFSISDIQVGNLKQGLVCARYSNNIDHSETDLLTVDYSVYNWQVEGTDSDYVEGGISAATLGAGITRLNGEKDHVFVEVTDLKFRLPFLPDNRLGSVLPAPLPDLQ
jgi:hypothetical protein